jgi:cold shock CspA family protein
MLGTVKTFHSDWGFITPDESVVDVFVHRKQIILTANNRNLQRFSAGDRVSYEIDQDATGRTQACNVRKID